MTFGLILGGVSLEGCGSDAASGGPGVKQTPAQRMCNAVKDSVARCGGGACDQALIADCEKVAGVLSDPFLTASADCMEKGGAAISCLGSSISALTPTPGQQEFVKSFCSDCPPVPIPGCEDALLGKGNVPEQLKSVKQLFSPFGDPVLQDIETQCFGGLTCVAELSSCVQKVLASRALPTNTIQCVIDSVLSGGTSSSDGGKCGDAGTGTGGKGGSGGSTSGGGSGGATGGAGGSGGVSTGGGGSGGFGATGGGGSGGFGATGGGGSGGTGGTTGSCVGYCGGQSPGGCYCDSGCENYGDCCADKQSACGTSTGGTGGGGSGGTGGLGGTGGAGGTGGTCTGDAYEPNDSSSYAKVIDTGGDGKISDCEAAQTLLANVGAGDVDWYKFTGVDGVCGLDNIQPHAKVTSSVSLKVCVYLKPLNSSSGAPSCVTGSPDSSVSGYYGCCGLNSARLQFGSNFVDDTATVLINVSAPNGACTAYTMEYAYGAN